MDCQIGQPKLKEWVAKSEYARNHWNLQATDTEVLQCRAFLLENNKPPLIQGSVNSPRTGFSKTDLHGSFPTDGIAVTTNRKTSFSRTSVFGRLFRRGPTLDIEPTKAQQ